jgi:hypothetical protein
MLADQVHPEVLREALMLAGYHEGRSPTACVNVRGDVTEYDPRYDFCEWQPRYVAAAPWVPGDCRIFGQHPDSCTCEDIKERHELEQSKNRLALEEHFREDQG